jgi:hypothetical protein
MDVSRANNGRMFDLFAQPFWVLGVNPAATNKQINDAFSRARQNQAAGALIFARDALLDPTRRLTYELSYPLDCPAAEIEAFYAALSSNDSIDGLLQFADRLWPLARANFVAHLASHRPADGALLFALLESHATLDANAIYADLKAARTTAGIPAPSWVNLNEDLNELTNTHAAAAFAGYETIQDAAEPVLECTRQCLAQGERHYVQALGCLLTPYRQSIDPLQKDVARQILCPRTRITILQSRLWS